MSVSGVYVRVGERWLWVCALVGVSSVALALRLYGIDWGIPNSLHPDHSYHPDEGFLLRWARRLVEGEVVSKHFIYGGTLYYSFANAFIYFGDLFGNSLPGLNLLADSILVGRYFNVLIALFTILLVFECGRLLYGTAVGLVSALMLAVIPAHVVYAQLLRPDEIGVLLVTLMLYLAARILKSERCAIWAAPVLTGMLAGAALAFRFPLVVFATMPFAAIVMRLRSEQPQDLVSCTVRAGLIGAAACFVTYVVTSPHTFMYLGKAMEGMRVTYGYQSVSFLDSLGNGPLIYQHFAVVLPQALSSGIYALGLLGVVFACCKRRNADVVILIGLFLYGVLLVNASWVVARYALPLAPFVVLLGARAVFGIVRGVSAVAPKVAMTVVCAGAVLWSAASTVAFLRMQGSLNVRDVAAQWIEHNVAPDAGILSAESYVGDVFFNPILPAHFRVGTLLLTEERDNAVVLGSGHYGFVVLPEVIYGNLERLVESHPSVRAREFHRSLMTHYTLYKEFKLPVRLGPVDFSPFFALHDYTIVNPGLRIYIRTASPGRR